jgi:predicted nucleotidyltransferase component of viral defense system
MIEKEQELLAEIVDLFAQKFAEKAILRGGMVLCMLGSPRLTNDLDYIFVPYSSKKDIVDEVIKALHTMGNVTVSHSMNSKCLRILITREHTTVQVEAKVAKEIQTATTSTRLFSPKYNFPPRLISVAEYSVALAHKMAAWNERRLVRDLYDIFFYIQMGISYDHLTLKQRLLKQNYSTLVKKDDYFKGKELSEFIEFLREATQKLSDKDIDKELSDYLPSNEIPGLAMQIRASLVKLS